MTKATTIGLDIAKQIFPAESSPGEPVRESNGSRVAGSATTEGTGVARIAVDRSLRDENKREGPETPREGDHDKDNR